MKSLYSNKKIVWSTLFVSILFFMIQGIVVHAQTPHTLNPNGSLYINDETQQVTNHPTRFGKYNTITPGGLPISQSAGNSFGSLLVEMFKWGVTAAAVLAVIMLIIGGVEYMGSESLYKKADGRTRIMSALGGLLIALLSILILTAIFGREGGDFIVNLSF